MDRPNDAATRRDEGKNKEEQKEPNVPPQRTAYERFWFNQSKPAEVVGGSHY